MRSPSLSAAPCLMMVKVSGVVLSWVMNVASRRGGEMIVARSRQHAGVGADGVMVGGGGLEAGQGDLMVNRRNRRERFISGPIQLGGIGPKPHPADLVFAAAPADGKLGGTCLLQVGTADQGPPSTGTSDRENDGSEDEERGFHAGSFTRMPGHCQPRNAAPRRFILSTADSLLAGASEPHGDSHGTTRTRWNLPGADGSIPTLTSTS